MTDKKDCDITSDNSKQRTSKKKPYTSPEVNRHGSLVELTLGGLSGMNDPAGPSTGKG